MIMIMIRRIKDYISRKYFDFITHREFNQKDPHYFGKVSDEIAEDLYDFFSELIENELNLDDEDNKD